MLQIAKGRCPYAAIQRAQPRLTQSTHRTPPFAQASTEVPAKAGHASSANPSDHSVGCMCIVRHLIHCFLTLCVCVCEHVYEHVCEHVCERVCARTLFTMLSIACLFCPRMINLPSWSLPYLISCLLLPCMVCSATSQSFSHKTGARLQPEGLWAAIYLATAGRARDQKKQCIPVQICTWQVVHGHASNGFHVHEGTSKSGHE